MEPIISVRELGKMYRILSHEKKQYRTLRDDLTDGIKGLLQGKLAKTSLEEYWALKDINFDIYPGEVVGIIGRNGAGKSTLLKILSRITPPTMGEIELGGRLGSLLEVGTGFHPELTGRENISLSGAILGMSRQEIKKKFDEIVAFAEVEKFLETPVKRYSSGMYVRLAFAVAAHLDPEILLVDEVLAVGDAQFQKKCLGKMEDIGSQGRTVIFVSHNMSVVQSLCKNCLVLEKGCLVANVATSEAVSIYLESSLASTKFTRPKQVSGKPTIISGSLASYDSSENPTVSIELEIFCQLSLCVSLDVRLANASGIPIGFGSLGALDSRLMIALNAGINFVSFCFSNRYFAVGTYYLSLDIALPDIEYYDRAENCLSFEVVRGPSEGAGRVLSQNWGYGSLEIPLQRL
jgi:lipopolysaccharide transport system ATP-binding protein